MVLSSFSAIMRLELRFIL